MKARLLLFTVLPLSCLFAGLLRAQSVPENLMTASVKRRSSQEVGCVLVSECLNDQSLGFDPVMIRMGLEK